MFLQLLRSANRLCVHNDESFTLDIQNVLKCAECDFSLSIPFYLLNVVDSTDSLRHAEEFAKWSGKNWLPCVIELYPIHKRLTAARSNSTFEHVVESVQLLKIIQDPLSRNPEPPKLIDIDLFQKTVWGRLDIAIDRVCTVDDDNVERDIGNLVRTALILLKDMVDIDRYLEVVVPYVKRIGYLYSIDQDLEEATAAESVSRSFQKRINLAYRIDRHLASKSVAFDAMQVAVLCCILRDNDPGTMVQDLVLDFAGRVCRGFYDDANFLTPCRSHDGETLLKNTEEILKEHVSLETNTEIYRHLELLRKGGMRLANSFSDRFFQLHWELEWALRECNGHEKHFDCAFPRILFSNYTDYYAFWAALSHYSVETDVENKTKNEVIRGSIVASPGVLWQCKSIYRFVKKVLAKTKTFHEFFVEEKLQELHKSVDCNADDWLLFRNGDLKIETTYVWSRELMKQFLKFDPEFSKELVDAVKKLPMLFTKIDLEWSPVPLDKSFKIYKL